MKLPAVLTGGSAEQLRKKLDAQDAKIKNLDDALGAHQDTYDAIVRSGDAAALRAWHRKREDLRSEQALEIEMRGPMASDLADAEKQEHARGWQKRHDDLQGRVRRYAEQRLARDYEKHAAEIGAILREGVELHAEIYEFNASRPAGLSLPPIEQPQAMIATESVNGYRDLLSTTILHSARGHSFPDHWVGTAGGAGIVPLNKLLGRRSAAAPAAAESAA